MEKAKTKPNILIVFMLPLYVVLLVTSCISLLVAVTERLVFKALAFLKLPLPKHPPGYRLFGGWAETEGKIVLLETQQTLQAVNDSLGRLKPPEAQTKLSDTQQAVATTMGLLEELEDSEEEVVDEIRGCLEQTTMGLVAVKDGMHRRNHDYLVLKPSKEENLRRICNALVLIPNSCVEQITDLLSRQKALIEIRNQEGS